MARGRPKKVKVVEPVIEEIQEVTVEKKAEPVKINETDIVLVKTNKYVAVKLIESCCKVVHMSGNGSSSNPKVWYIEASIRTLDGLSQDEQDQIEKTSYDEIHSRISNSIALKEKEKAESYAQKKKPGAQPEASAHY